MNEALTIFAINIHGATSKTEDDNFISLCNKYNIIILTEIKHTYPMSVPGFKCIRSKVMPNEENRGGVIVMIHAGLWPKMCNISVEPDQVWFSLSHVPNIVIGAVYITPRDSPYYKPESLAIIQEKIDENKERKIVIIGDLNSRMRNIQMFNNEENDLFYEQNPDQNTNENGKDLLTFCKEHKLIPVNHMNHKNIICDGGLTYKKGPNWISQLDWALCSETAMENISALKIERNHNLPTDHAGLSLSLSKLNTPIQSVLTRAKELGAYPSQTENGNKNCSTAIPMHTIDVRKFTANLPKIDDIWQNIAEQNNMDKISDDIVQKLYETSYKSKNKNETQLKAAPRNAAERWNNILAQKNPKELWAAINWKGSMEKTDQAKNKPSDKEFCSHFEKLLNPEEHRNQEEYIPTRNTYIPVLDDPIEPDEVDNCIKRLKTSKAPGPDGIAPGILKHLPDDWIILLTFVYNAIFNQNYPLAWSIAKVFTIFKKGDSSDPSNYRGISIMSAIAKVYDSIISNRFNLWYKPHEEQAGAQKNRGCEEQILTVRLLIDIARKTKETLYIAFIDYEKAYDRLNRKKLYKRLDDLGCGTKFLMAIQKSMEAKGCIGNESFNTCIGTKQGGATSCNTFTCHIDPTIEAVKAVGPDGWLGETHILLFMDDTVIFATSRNKLHQKLTYLKTSADDLGMRIHPTKSKYMCINSNDSTPFKLDNIQIDQTNNYMYLGAPISDSEIEEQIENQLKQKQAHILKFTSFLSKNSDSPFPVKKKVWESALNSAIFYSCETWLTNNLQTIEKSYMSTIKQMLSVRQTTCHDIIQLELGIGNAKSLVQDRQAKYLNKLMERQRGTYIQRTIDLAISKKTKMGKQITSLKNNNTMYKEKYILNLKEKVRQSDRTKRKEYCTLNPELKPHTIYKNPTLPEHHRIGFTRMRLSSHHLRIETGRWSRIQRENRLCQCTQGIQTEEHVLLKCNKTAHLRENIEGIQSCSNLVEFYERPNQKEIAELCYKTLKVVHEL